MNRVILIGNIGRIDERVSPSGLSVVKIGLAINERTKEKRKTHWVNCTAFGKTADLLRTHFQKGKAICLEGRLDYQTWTDKQTNAVQSALGVVIERIEFLPLNEKTTIQTQQEFPSLGQTTADAQHFFSEEDIPF